MRRMVELDVTNYEILVAGDPGNGKANFIQRFLENFPPSAEVRNRHATVYCLYQPDEGRRIQLYDVNSVENMNRGAYDKMDAVLFYYAANDPESFQSLEKWIALMDSPLQTKKVLSILVADSSKLGHQRDVAECLAEQANKLKDAFGIKLFIESSFEDEESAFRAFEIIIDEVFSSKLSEQSSVNGEESDEKSFKTCPTETSRPTEPLNRCLDELSSSSSSHYCSRTSEGIQKLACFLKELQV